jgi:hypothetical protein
MKKLSVTGMKCDVVSCWTVWNGWVETRRRRSGAPVLEVGAAGANLRGAKESRGGGACCWEAEAAPVVVGAAGTGAGMAG